MKELSKQIKSSRLILTKLITGNSFSNLDQVKNELNSVLADFVQEGCNSKTVPYLTDANSLGKR